MHSFKASLKLGRLQSLRVKDCKFDDDVMLDQILALTPETAPLLELDLSYNRCSLVALAIRLNALGANCA